MKNLNSIKNNSDKKKILFILPSLKAGGAERVLSFLTKQLDKTFFDVKLIVLGFEKDAVYNTEFINVSYLNKKRFLYSLYPLIKVLRKEKPSIVFTSIGHINLTMGFLSLFFRKIIFIAREASVISKMSEFSSSKSKVLNFLTRFFYPKLNLIICQSKDMKNDFISFFNLDEKKLFVINNPITLNEEPSKQIIKTKYKSHINFITIGRLNEEKGHKRILKGLATIKNYSFTYTLIGSGPLKNDVQNLAKELNILENIKLIPYTSKVLNFLAVNDYFIQGSYVEGFPNTLLESCSVGTPVIAFKCPGGTREIIQEKVNGYLVNNEDEFKKLLINLNDLPFLNSDIVKESVFSKFSSSKIISEYQKLFLNIK